MDMTPLRLDGAAMTATQPCEETAGRRVLRLTGAQSLVQDALDATDLRFTLMPQRGRRLTLGVR
ncbi:MAG: hypothetical protein AAF631_08835 [Pseudomonadota bacterium]